MAIDFNRSSVPPNPPVHTPGGVGLPTITIQVPGIEGPRQMQIGGNNPGAQFTRDQFIRAVRFSGQQNSFFPHWDRERINQEFQRRVHEICDKTPEDQND